MNRQHIPDEQRRGVSAVEFAVVVPLLVLVLLGSVELGRATMVQHTLQEAARSACRRYIVEDATITDVENMVAATMDAANITGYTVTRDPVLAEDIDTHMEPVTVSVSVDYDQVSWLAPWFMGGTTLVGTCVMPADTDPDAPPDPPPPAVTKSKKVGKKVATKGKTKGKVAKKAKKAKSKKAKKKS